jgi:hypothetical protein
MVGWLLNNELEKMWNEAVMAKWTYPSTCIEGLRKSMQIQSQEVGDQAKV